MRALVWGISERLAQSSTLHLTHFTEKIAIGWADLNSERFQQNVTNCFSVSLASVGRGALGRSGSRWDSNGCVIFCCQEFILISPKSTEAPTKC